MRGREESRGREERDAARLDGADHGGLDLSGEVGVDDSDAAERGHGGGHGGFGDGVHRRSDDRSVEREAAREVGGERNIVGGEVDVVREENHVVVGVGVALVEQTRRREPVFYNLRRRHC